MRISLGYRILCDLCKKKDALYRASFVLVDKETRHRTTLKIGDACEGCSQYVYSALLEITGGNDEKKKNRDVSGVKGKRSKSTEVREDNILDTSELEDQD